MREQQKPLNREACRPGTAAVELAIVLPVLLLLVFGCVDFGRGAYHSMALDNAVSSGSHYAATHRFTDYTLDTWKTRIRETVIEEMNNVPDFDAESLQITISATPTVDAGYRVVVTASYPFETIVDWPGLPKTVLLQHRVAVLQYK